VPSGSNGGAEAAAALDEDRVGLSRDALAVAAAAPLSPSALLLLLVVVGGLWRGFLAFGGGF